jgi:hypothetical protein
VELDDYRLPSAQGWLTEAACLMEAAIPADHTCRRDWSGFETQIRSGDHGSYYWDRLFAIFQVAHRLVRNDRLGSFIASIRAETEDELLDQAIALLAQNHLAAATVIAGGALETHLRHLVAGCGLSISGEGSISAYNDKLAQARNKGTQVPLTSADTKQVTYWGEMRNQAAHKPLEYKRRSDEVDLMIQGIRSLISRTT